MIHAVTIVLVFLASMAVVFSLGFVAGASWSAFFRSEEQTMSVTAPHPDPEVVAYAVRSLLRDIDPYWGEHAFETIMSLVRQCEQEDRT